MAHLDNVGNGISKEYINGLVNIGKDVLAGKANAYRLESKLGVVQSGAWRANLENMMNELVGSQFTDPLAAIRENVSNARDARPKTGIYVGIPAPQQLYIIDDGDGMGKRDVREHLLGIFDSSKGGDKDSIGRFGIGRLANLKVANAIIYDTKQADGSPITVVITGKRRNGDSYQIFELPGSRGVNGTTVVLLVNEEHARILNADGIEALLSSQCAWINSPLYFNGKPMNKPFDIEASPKLSFTFESAGMKGVIGLAPNDYSQVSIMQKGMVVGNEYVLGGKLVGMIDSDKINPVIGRAGIVNDAEYAKVMAATRQKILELGAQVAQKDMLSESDVNFLRALVHDYFSYGKPAEKWAAHPFPESVKDALIIPTVFGKSLLSALTQEGGIEAIVKHMAGASDTEHVSLNILSRAGKDHIYYSPNRTQVTEDLRKKGEIVVRSESDGLIRIIGGYMGINYWDLKSAAQVPQDIEVRPYSPSSSEQRLLELFEDFGVKGVMFGDIRNKSGEVDTDTIALHGSGKEKITFNANSSYVQKMVELAGQPDGGIAALLLLYPALSHEEAHGLMGRGGHSEEFYQIQDLIMQERSMRYAGKLLKRIRSERSEAKGIADSNGTAASGEGTFTLTGIVDAREQSKGLAEKVMRWFNLRRK